MTGMNSEYITVKDLVEYVLDEDPAARIDNRILVLRAWDHCGLHLTEQQWAAVAALPQPETLRRTKAKIRNEEGRYND